MYNGDQQPLRRVCQVYGPLPGYLTGHQAWARRTIGTETDFVGDHCWRVPRICMGLVSGARWRIGAFGDTLVVAVRWLAGHTFIVAAVDRRIVTTGSMSA